ncbi:hypothetical protein QBC39DRAFT_96390 [Podospora conica]|nr:hypothetical protein QBC39DRAFT_96390 [Schizothecium conicum]
MAQPSLSSNNPFRRNGAGASAPAAAPPSFDVDALEAPSPAAPSPSSSEHFRSHLQTLSQPAHPPPATSFQKPKVVKKVRVQSPPPSSPESAGAPESYPRRGRYDESDTSDDEDDDVNPFSITPQAPPTRSEDEQIEVQPTSTLHRAPPNPFQRTLQDIELGSDGIQQNTETLPGTRAALDVDAFKRLLLTGQAGASKAAPATQIPQRAGDGANLTDSSSLSRQSISGASTHLSIQDTPRTSHDISDREADDDRHGLTGSARPNIQTSSSVRKKPPPPSSRHGKLIRPEPMGKSGSEDAPTSHGSSTQTPRETTTPLTSPFQGSSTPLKVNKPLPVPPTDVYDKVDGVLGQDGGAVQMPAETTADEILPVPQPPTPPKASHSIPTAPSTTSQTKKPPPPPRRQPHGRSESRASIHGAGGSQPSVHNPDERDLTARRSSQDSTRSRSSSLRVSIHAPAPPPPRRPAHHSRPSNSFISPSSISFSSPTPSGSERSPSELPEFSPLPTPSIAAEISASETPVSSTAGHSTPHLKHFPPPPPPARNASTRSKRPPSVHSIEAPSRRPSSHAGLPPPPPPRQRGGSKGSVDGVVVGTRPAVEPVRILEGSFAEEPEGGRAAEEPGASTDILADLTALQREVDALRGKVAKTGTEA